MYVCISCRVCLCSCGSHTGSPASDHFRKNRGTLNIFAARQLQEKCREQQSCLYSTYVDLTKAFDTVSRDGLWRIMAKFGCPPRFISMVRQFHVGMQAIEFVIMAQYPSHSQSQTVSSKDASWCPHCLASCSWQCYQMPSGMGMLESKSITEWMASYSISDG